VFRSFTKQGMRAQRCNALAAACQAARFQGSREVGEFFWVEELDAETVEQWRSTWLPLIENVPPNGGWDWGAVYGRLRGSHEEFCIALKSGDGTLCGLCYLTLARKAVRFEAVEGNPDVNHPLKKSVLPIMLDVAFSFAQRLGKKEVRAIDPGPALTDIYLNTFEFELVKEPNGRTWCKKAV